jgi:hypothetical protein
MDAVEAEDPLDRAFGAVSGLVALGLDGVGEA